LEINVNLKSEISIVATLIYGILFAGLGWRMGLVFGRSNLGENERRRMNKLFKGGINMKKDFSSLF
jgi:hypothetical protein